MQAIILAGGKGTRLKPYTNYLPKPLVPIHDHPILEIVIRQLKNNGFKEITLAVGYLAPLIEAYFGDGSKFGVEIKYSLEDKPLGTAGPIKLIKGLNENFLVINSDDLTDLNYQDFFNFHKNNDSLVSIAMFQKKVNISLGVLQIDHSNKLTDYIEKPTYDFNVSMGIYAFHQSVLDYIPEKQYFDFPDLIKSLLENNEKVNCYPFSGFWLDIGRPEDYEKANENFEILNLDLQEEL